MMEIELIPTKSNIGDLDYREKQLMLYINNKINDLIKNKSPLRPSFARNGDLHNYIDLIATNINRTVAYSLIDSNSSINHTTDLGMLMKVKVAHNYWVEAVLDLEQSKYILSAISDNPIVFEKIPLEQAMTLGLAKKKVRLLSEIAYDIQSKWKRLVWRGFSEEKMKLAPLYLQAAQNILFELLNQKIGIVADVGEGKTILTNLLIFANFKKVLFLAPAKYLAEEQHAGLWGAMTGLDDDTQIITGSLNSKKRNWQSDKRIIYCTPQTFINDFNKGKIDLTEFDLLVVDEMHMAVGNYDYVPIADIFTNNGIKILGLSATPGEDPDKMLELMNVLHISSFIRVKVRPKELQPKRTEYFYKIPLSDYLLEAESKFKEIFRHLQEQMLAYNLISEIKLSRKGEIKMLKETEVKNAEALVDDLKGYHFYQAKIIMAKYRKLYHAYRTLLAECPFAFLEYVKSLREGDKKSNKIILNNHLFLNIVDIAQINIDNHPKVDKLISIMRPYVRAVHFKGLIHVGQKDTAKYLYDRLNKEGMRVEIVTGGQGRDMKKIKQSLDRLKNDKLDAIIATTVLKQGIAIEEVKFVINYSMPLNGTAKIQWGGRTARQEDGQIDFLILDHPIDQGMFWKSWHHAQEIKDRQSPRLKNLSNVLINPKRRYKKQLKDKQTLNLFDQLQVI